MQWEELIRRQLLNSLWPSDHPVQLYSRHKMDWTVQSWKLSYRKENSLDIGLKFLLYRQKYSNIVTGGKIQKRFMHFQCSYFPEKNRYSPTRREKCHFHCSLDQTTLFPNKFTFLIYSMNQYTHSVSRECKPMAWIFNKQSKSKPEPVRKQWGYCCRGEIPLYTYWPDRQYKNLIASLTVHTRWIPILFRRLVADVITVALWGKSYHKHCRLYGISLDTAWLTD